MAVIHLLLGSNIGNRLKQLEKAREQVEGKIGKIVKKSKVYETQPWGENEQDEFLNQALEVESKLKPKKVLEKIAEIEKYFL